jgi:cellulose synthase/poly-beta-1,6-N-acetylglucosamine synthase-like glycosyltransferase
MLKDLETNDVVLGAYYAKKNDNWLVNVQNLHCLIKLKYGGLKGRPTIGVNNAFHIDVIKKIGYFDESKTSVTEDFIKKCEQADFKIKFNPEIVVLTEFTKSMKGFLKQRLRWNENSITFLKDGKITVFDILGFGYGIGLSFILFASFILSVITLNHIYLLLVSLGVLLVLFLYYAKPFFRISLSEDRYYAKYYAGYLLMEMILRVILFPHFVYRLIKPQTKPTFETNRN